MSNVFVFRQLPPGVINEYFGGGGKGGTTTSSQTVSIPPEVLARYNAVNARAEDTAQQPFQQYGGEFVAPLTPTQIAGTQATNAAAGQAQPYYNAATRGLQEAQQGGSNYIGAATNQLLGAQQQADPYFGGATMAALAGGQAVDPGRLETGRYMNPYTRNVVGATQAAMGQQQGQQLAQQQAEAIRSGAFGGERAGLQRQTLRGQQELAQAQVIAPLYQQGYQQALQTAQQQQGVGLGAAQANRQALQQMGQQLSGLGQQRFGVGQSVSQGLGALGQQGYAMGAGTAQQLAGLGTGAQQAALQGAQAQLAAGQVGQQTQQAQDTAQYQQFLQERGYPFQVAQFLANIAMGTGALSGSTTTGSQTSPGGFFSDKRLKNDVKEIGETHDGQPIYSYKYNGDDRTQIGLMAQDVEKKHPDAVGLMGGYKTVDYKKATEDAERTHKDMGGGLMPDGFDPNSMGGAVSPDMAGEGFERGGYVGGGLVDANDWASIVAANKQALGMYGGAQPMGGPVGATGIVPAATIPVPKPIEAAKMSMPAQRPSGMSTAMQTGKDIAGAYSMGKAGLIGSAKTAADPEGSAGLIGGQGEWGGKNLFSKAKELFAADGGFIVPRHAYALGGSDEEDVTPYDVKDTMSGQDPMKEVLRSGSQKPQQLKAAQMAMSNPNGQQSGLGSLASGLGTAKGLYEMGSGAASGLGALGSGFGAAQNAAGLDAALGPGFFAENIGLGAGGASAAGSGLMGSIGSGLGSLFAEAGPFALLLKDGGRIPAYADGGLVPRQGYALQGATDVPADYSPEADMPSPNAQEAARYSEEDLDRAARDALALQMRRESGGDSQAKAKTSSAAGMYQITNPTAKGLIARNPQWGIEYQDVPHFAATLSPEQQQTLGLGLSKEHVRTLANQGFEPTPQNVSANWFLGGGGGPAFLKAMQTDPSMPATSAAGQDQIRANPTMFFKQDGSPRSVSEVYSMLNKTGGGAPVPPSLVGAGMQPASTSGAGEKKGLVDTVTSEGFLVPALGFLGSMLASDKRNLGQALGEGIMGGVGAYQQQRKMLPEVAKTEAEASLQNVAAINSLSSGLKQYNAMNGTNLTLQQFAKLSPAEIAKYAGTEAAGAVSGQKTSAKGYSFTPEEMQSLIIKHPGGADIPAYMDPGYLNEYKSHYAGWGDNAYAKSQLAFADKQIEKTGTTTLSSAGEVVPTPGAIQTGQQALSGQQRVAMSSDFEKKGAEFRPMSVNIETHLDQLADALQRFKTGADAPSRANLSKLMEAVDPDHKFKSLHNNEGTDYDKIIKSAMAIQISQLQGLSARAPAAELNALSQQIVRPIIQPEAARQIVANLKATNAYQRKMYDEYDPEKFGYNISSYQKDFIDKNPYPEFRDKIVKDIAPGAGTQQQREQTVSDQPPVSISSVDDVSKLKPGTPFTIPSGPNKGKIGYAQ